MILLANEVIVFLFSELLLWLMQAVAFYFTIRILAQWDFDASTARQYRLEKQSYLVVLIIFVALLFKIFLLPFFSYTIDTLSNMVPGAMCAAGVITANSYGPSLMFLKVAIVFLIGIWLILNAEDIKARAYPFFRIKFWLFILIFTLVSLESVMDVLFFVNISTQAPVACCSSIYGMAGGGGGIPFSLDIERLLILFYLLFALTLVAAYYRYHAVALGANLIFLIVGYYAVVYFFGTYVYELPTHLCPFCMLQHEYYYIGYLIWGTLFLGTFFGMAAAVLKWIIDHEVAYLYRLGALFNAIFVSLCSMYVVAYYLRTGVLLS